MNRSYCEKNHNDWIKAMRRRRVDQTIGRCTRYNNLHQYSKAPIRMDKDAKNDWGNTRRLKRNWPIHDVRKIQSLLDQSLDIIKQEWDDDIPFYTSSWDEDMAFEEAYDLQTGYDDWIDFWDFW